MTNLTEELQRLNALDAKRTQGGSMMEYEHGGGRLALINQGDRVLIADFYNQYDREFYAAAPDTIALANKLHGLLVQAEAALGKVMVLGLEPNDLPDNIRISRAFTAAQETLTALHAALKESE